MPLLKKISHFSCVLGMKKTLTFLALVVFVVVLCSFLVKVGQAGSISLGTYDTTGLPRDFFIQGKDVRIIADSSDMPITINVTDPDGMIVHNETYYGYTYDKILSGLTEKLGNYTVEATSPWDEVQKNYARTYFRTAPLSVGGKATPINSVMIKPGLQIPWIWLSAIILAVSISVAYLKYRKKQ
ncbi:MAG: hypothetical protein OEX10_01480 [Candidatus Bathyarchaeota archaeon]|nr:hypothetical protein [Candidatus Bathyarchaeota archaeon]